MNHTTQEPKSMQLAVELDYRREYEAAHELRVMQARIAELESGVRHAEYKMEGWLCKQYPLEACFYPESKDWIEGDYRDRVEWLHTMYESVKSEVAQLKAQLHTISTGGVGESFQPPVQPDTVLPVSAPTGWKLVPVKHTLDMSIAFTETWYSERRCIDDPDMQDAWQSMIDAAPEAPAPAQPPVAHQEPVAWRVHPFDCGIGSKGAFALTMRPEQVEMWKRKGLRVEPLYTAPQLT